MNETEDDEERIHFQSVVNAFKFYRVHALQRLSKTEHYFKTLPQHHQNLMKDYSTHLKHIRNCIEANDAILRIIIQDVEYMFVNITPVEHRESHLFNHRQTSDEADMEKVEAALKQLVRDWSEDGAKERECCYQPIIDEITSNYPVDVKSVQDIKILVPGAGLGRLAFEIARRGYTCQGNEFSLYMLFASQFVLNKCSIRNMYQIYPWIHQYVNNMKSEHQTKAVSFPDIDPTELMSSGSTFTMAAGDFVEVYREPNVWDCVATCFFIDCASNIAQFIETIFNILKPGGLWVNLGPLLYHFSDIPNEVSIEPSYEIVREIILGMGFIFEREETDVPTAYAQNPNSMLQYEYRSVFFSCRKPLPIEPLELTEGN